MALFIAIASLSYAMLAPEWYKAEVLIAPVKQADVPSLGGQLGGLAAIAGVSMGDGDAVDAVATLKSRELTRELIDENDLLPVLFSSSWDRENNQWRIRDPAKWPDERDAIRYFHEKVLRVSQDRKTGLVTVEINWVNPKVAASWAMGLVQVANSKLRDRALGESERNVQYLQREFSNTNVIAQQQAIGRLLEGELQKLMLARGNSEFAFRVIDAAYPPKFREAPKRIMITVLGTAFGVFLGLAWVLLPQMLRPNPK
jgi:uncharacterized protein involved in exopolysaccharide biosynthesis